MWQHEPYRKLSWAPDQMDYPPSGSWPATEKNRWKGASSCGSMS